MGAGASIPKEFNSRLQEELKKSASTKVEDIEDHTQEVRRLRKIIHDGCKTLEDEKARQGVGQKGVVRKRYKLFINSTESYSR